MVPRLAHNQKVVGSTPASATKFMCEYNDRTAMEHVLMTLVEIASLTIKYSLFVNLWTELMKTCAGSNSEVVLAKLTNVGNE